MPSTVLTIAGVDLDNLARSAARVQMEALVLNLDGGYDSFAFAEIGGHPLATWDNGTAVTITWIKDDLSEHLVFDGTIVDCSHNQAGTGWLISYQCSSKKHLADHVPVTGFDLTGMLAFNRSPEDPSYTAAESGLDVGQIIRFALCIGETAAALDAIGVGNYTTLSPPTLPTVTLDDLDLLTVVPPQQVVLSGVGILNQIEQMVQHWMPKWVMEQTPGGTIRFKDTTDCAIGGTFVPATVILPNAVEAAHTVTWPVIRKSTSRCATRVVIRGAAEVEPALLSTADGTLEPAWDSTQEAAWTLSDFTSPKDAYSEGAVSSVTGSSCTINPDDATEAKGANFWADREAWIFLSNTLADGIDVWQSRPVTSSTAYAAGANGTVTWDASWPLDSSGYTRYRLVGKAGGNADVGRLYNVREPNTDALGMDTYVGSHLVRRSELPIRFANISGTGGFQDVFYPFGYVCWSSDGTPPYNEFPVNVEVDPTAGQFRFTQPVVSIFGSPDDLELGYPTDPDQGEPGDVRVLALYSRGTLLAIAPPNTGVGLDVPDYAGTAYADEGLAITKVIDLPSWTNRGDFTRLQELAEQHLSSLQDVVYEGSFDWYGLPPWDWWEFTTCVNFSLPPHTGLWEDLNAPIRSVRLTWPAQEGLLHKLTISFSNQRRPHSGDDLYIPAAFSGNSGIDPGALNDQSQTFAGQGLIRGIGAGLDGWKAAEGGTTEAGIGGMNATGMAGVQGMNEGRLAGMNEMRDAGMAGVQGMREGADAGIAASRGMGGPSIVDTDAFAGAKQAVDNQLSHARQAVMGPDPSPPQRFASDGSVGPGDGVGPPMVAPVLPADTDIEEFKRQNRARP